MKITKLILPTLLIIISTFAFGQKGKHGTPTLPGTAIVNEFTTLSSDASSGATTINVASSTLNSNAYSWFGGNLEAGDLIMIIQMQGVDMIGAPSWNSEWGNPIDPTWGQITDYYNCGNNEYAEVKSIPNGTSIELRCGLSNGYTSTGNVQIVRVPRFDDLTISGTLTTEAWNGNTGGVLAIEVNNNLIINGEITASELGFRGGIANTAASLLGVAHWTRPLAEAGGLKGESVRGWSTEYDIHGGSYCKAAPANGGGGGNAHNGGGGGGGNAGDILNWIDGVGVPQGNYNAWDIETLKDEVTPAPIGGVARSGGGRGGHTFSGSNQNANTLPTGNTAWGGDNHKNRGGLGGRPLDYSGGRIYLGGAGGAADINESTTIGGGGGNGGGIVYILNYGSVSGSGSITSNGENGEDATAASASLFNVAGTDGAGGAGAGGTVLINSNNAITGTVTINVNGGDGGNQIIIDGGFGDMDEAEGPGGGGGGGYASVSGGAITTTANGGMNGTTNSSGLTEFPMNGATSGGIGLPNETISNFHLTTTNDTICSGTTSTLTATVTGTLSGTITWYDAEVGGNIIGTNVFTTGALTSDTVFYVGTCPGNYLIPVSVIISPLLIVDNSSMIITDQSCGLTNGGISGISITGGTGTLTFDWNGSSSVDEDLANVVAGNYTLTATDGIGCTVTSGPHTISSTSSPVIDASSISTTDESCSLTNGNITGITVSGGIIPYNYSWNGTTTLTADSSNLAAGSYTLIVTDASGCTDQTGPYTIIDNSAPLLDTSSIVITNETCGSTNGSITGITTIGGNAPLTYNWNGNNTLTEDSLLLGGGSYTLTVTDALGCVVVSNPVIVNNIGLTVDTTTLALVNDACTQGSGSLSGITVSGGSTPYVYSWNGTPSSTADTTSLFAGTYTLTITDNTGCIFTTNPYTIVDNSGPTIDTTAMVITPETCSLSNGAVAGITSSGGLTPFTYSWNGNSTLTEDTSGITGGNYTLTVTDGNGCLSSMGPIVVNSTSPPTIDTSSIDIIHENCYASDGSISGITVNNGAAPYIFNWNGATGPIDTTSLASGSYILSVTDNNGCTVSLGAITINNSGAPVANFTLSGDPLALEEVLLLTNTSSVDAVTYLWDLGDGTTSTETSPSTTYSNDGAYSICLIAYTASSCTDTICKTVNIIEEIESTIGIPSAFSPNNDTHNDILYVRGSGIASYTFMIYNRYGEKVFETTDFNEGWDGNFKGKPENTGVFAYYIEYEFANGERGELKGNVTLVK